MRVLAILLGLAVAGALFFAWQHEKMKKDERNGILERARDAKAAKSLVKNSETPETEN